MNWTVAGFWQDPQDLRNVGGCGHGDSRDSPCQKRTKRTGLIQIPVKHHRSTVWGSLWALICFWKEVIKGSNWWQSWQEVDDSAIYVSDVVSSCVFVASEDMNGGTWIAIRTCIDTWYQHPSKGLVLKKPNRGCKKWHPNAHPFGTEGGPGKNLIICLGGLTAWRECC